MIKFLLKPNYFIRSKSGSTFHKSPELLLLKCEIGFPHLYPIEALKG